MDKQIVTLPAGNKKIQKALILIIQYGGFDGAHHKDWVLDQVARILAGDVYDDMVKSATNDHPEYWSSGIAP